jgi:hypothetical protein
MHLNDASGSGNWVGGGGAKAPETKHFTRVSYDAVTRTFRGTIDWYNVLIRLYMCPRTTIYVSSY